MGGARDQPGTWSALEHCRPWGHWGRGQLRVDWGFVECARCRRGIVHSGAECYQQGVCGERAAWGTEALWPAGAHRGILHASQAGRPQRSPESNTCLSHHHPLLWPCLPFLRNGLPSAFWPFHGPLGEPFPSPQPLVAGLWPLPWRSLTLRCPGHRVWGGGPSHHTVLWVSAL